MEFVTPICTYDDIETIQELVRRFRKAGGFANESCGIHVHIGADRHTAKTLKNLVNIIAAKEDLLYQALEVNVDRERYCKRMDTSFLNALNNRPPRSMSDMSDLWYCNNEGSSTARHHHYHDSRYHALNLHSVFTKGTVEFRLFNSSLKHAGKIKAYIQLCLAISHQALTQTSASRIRTATDNPKYTFRCWLLRLGLIGDEFKTARTQLLEPLPGNVAWRNPEQAVRQRERQRIIAAALHDAPSLEPVQSNDFKMTME